MADKKINIHIGTGFDLTLREIALRLWGERENGYWKNHGRIHVSRKESVPVTESKTARRIHTAMRSTTPVKMLSCELPPPNPADDASPLLLYPMSVIIPHFRRVA